MRPAWPAWTDRLSASPGGTWTTRVPRGSGVTNRVGGHRDRRRRPVRRPLHERHDRPSKGRGADPSESAPLDAVDSSFARPPPARPRAGPANWRPCPCSTSRGSMPRRSHRLARGPRWSTWPRAGGAPRSTYGSASSTASRPGDWSDPSLAAARLSRRRSLSTGLTSFDRRWRLDLVAHLARSALRRGGPGPSRPGGRPRHDRDQWDRGDRGDAGTVGPAGQRGWAPPAARIRICRSATR